MPKSKDIKKVLLLGSGPIVIGQGAEFDYAGVEALTTLKEEGVIVIVINSNPATIMTDRDTSVRVYLEPLTFSSVEDIIEKERPTAIMPICGGQVALNLVVELGKKGVLARYGVQVLGTSLPSIILAEDRADFKAKMEDISEPSLPSVGVKNIEEALSFAKKEGFPLIFRTAFTLGGLGTGVLRDEAELVSTFKEFFSVNLQGEILLEKSAVGLKEIEYEVLRDGDDQTLIVAEMENIDPVGIHTGDSMVVSPIKTLRQEEKSLLECAARKIVRALSIIGACNVQFAFNEKTSSYYVIEVNPRLSRSSALASKATGYPIAKMATKIALGYTLDEILPQAKKAGKDFSLMPFSYTVVKMPLFSFEKFSFVEENLGTKMKATGEVMAVGRDFSEAFLKALSSLPHGDGLLRADLKEASREVLERRVAGFFYDRIFYLAEMLRRGICSLEFLAKISFIDGWFLKRLEEMVHLAERLKSEDFSLKLLKEAYLLGFSTTQIKKLSRKNVSDILKVNHLQVSYKEVYACGERNFPAYSYSTRLNEKGKIPLPLETKKKKMLVIGSGGIAIGQGIEFDYASVHAINTLKKMNYATIMVNNNPATVSTDFSVADRLYFEPLTAEYIIDICRREDIFGALLSFGGQTALNLASSLDKEGIKILGTSKIDIMRAEDRKLFRDILQKEKIPFPTGTSVQNKQEAYQRVEELSYPLIVRPSYVLGGRAMEIFYAEEDFLRYLGTKREENYPLAIDAYLEGMEVEVDAIGDGKDVLILGILEEVERAGVHSGDSIAFSPTPNLSEEMLDTIAHYMKRLARIFHLKGLFNVQFTIFENKAYVLELNPRASRTVPFWTKMTGLLLVEIAVRAMLGESLKEQGFLQIFLPRPSFFAVKVPVFSFSHLPHADMQLLPEMKSTGEVMGMAPSFIEALCKAFIASNVHLSLRGGVFLRVAGREKKNAEKLAQAFHKINFKIFLSEDTAEFLAVEGEKISLASEEIFSLIKAGKINFIIHTMRYEEGEEKALYHLYSIALAHKVVFVASLDTAWAFYKVICALQKGLITTSKPLEDYYGARVEKDDF